MTLITVKNERFEHHQFVTIRQEQLSAKIIDKPTAIYIRFEEQLDYGKVENLLKIAKDGTQSYLKRTGAIHSTLKFNMKQQDSGKLQHIYGTMNYVLNTLTHNIIDKAASFTYQVTYQLSLAEEDLGQQRLSVYYNKGDNNERH